ncbi:MAG: lamin tail domain-containing protein [Anaerolineae bacterium]
MNLEDTSGTSGSNYAANSKPRGAERHRGESGGGVQRFTLLVFTSLLAVLSSVVWARAGALWQVTPHDSKNQFQVPTVVINEVAWGGTAASYADEWIELYNTTEVTISLVGWRIHAADGDPDIALTGEISPYSYYLIERTDDTTVSDIPADLICTFGRGLHNDGETLLLKDGAGTLVDTVNGDGGPWPNGDEGASPDYRSMERLTPVTPDQDPNWLSNDGSLTTGLDSNGAPVWGTPRHANAVFLPYYVSNADLAISKEGPVVALAGTAITYHVRLWNTGGLTAANVAVVDRLPGDLEFLTQDSELSFSYDNQTLSWLAEEIPPETVCTIAVRAMIEREVSRAVTLTNCVTATTSTSELSSHDNTATWPTLVQPSASDLRAAKTGPSQIRTTAPFTYRLIVSNTGILPASGVILTDRLPSDLKFLDQSSSLIFQREGQLLRWETPDLEPATGREILLRVEPDVDVNAINRITNRITVTSETPDRNPADNAASWTIQVGAPDVLISGVLYDGYQLNDADEAVELTNRGTVPAELAGWELCKVADGNLRCREIPATTLVPGERVWLARDLGAFRRSFGMLPAYTLDPWLSPVLANAGDEVVLRDPSRGTQDNTIDTVVYGAGDTSLAGWQGAPLAPYYNHLRGEEGQILARMSDEATGLAIPDTDTAADWLQVTTNFTYGRRVLYPGWDVNALFRPLSVTEAANVTVGVAPDNAFDVISETLMRARSSITAELYTLRHPDLIHLLAAKAEEGVSVSLLLEGNPVGIGVESVDWHTQLYACQAIEAAGGACWFMVHFPEDRLFNRYPYLHSKLIVVDDRWTVVSTQNLTPGGLPSDDKLNGTLGSRGIVLVTDAPSVVHRASRILSLDLDPANHNDLIRWNTGYLERYGPPNSGLVDLAPVDGISYTVRFPAPFAAAARYHFELFTAPEAALRRSDALLGLLQRAGPGDRIRVEQLYERVAWGEDPLLDPNLRLKAYVDAARRGAKVWILLNGRNFVEGQEGDAEDGIKTATYLNDLARREQLRLWASTGNPTHDGIHNKMVLVDLSNGEKYVHIGSMNGSEAAHKVNREVAVQVRSSELHDYLASVFDFDWCQSNPIYFPILFNSYSPPLPPVDHLVISEVAYTGFAAGEWIEIFNPTTKVIDLTDHKLGDAATPQDYEPMFAFPRGTSILPETVLVIAINGNQVPFSDFEFYDNSPEVPNMVPYPAWGSQAYPLALRDGGDHVLLLNASNLPIDVVVWGDKQYPNLTPHPGVTTLSASLERQPPYYDTDNCSEDFVERYPPTPGEVTLTIP